MHGPWITSSGHSLEYSVAGSWRLVAGFSMPLSWYCIAISSSIAAMMRQVLLYVGAFSGFDEEKVKEHCMRNDYDFQSKARCLYMT